MQRGWIMFSLPFFSAALRAARQSFLVSAFVAAATVKRRKAALLALRPPQAALRGPSFRASEKKQKIA